MPLPPQDYPSPAQILERPELAALTVLFSALETARQAIRAAHPDTHFLHVSDAPACHDAGEQCWAAHTLAWMAAELQEEIDNYFVLPEPDEEEVDGMPVEPEEEQLQLTFEPDTQLPF